MGQELQVLVFVGGLSRTLNSAEIVHLRGASFATLRLNERSVSEKEREMTCSLPGPLAMFSRGTLNEMLFLAGIENGEDHTVVCGCSGNPLRPYARIPASGSSSRDAQAFFLIPGSAAVVSSLKPSPDLQEFLVGVDRRWIAFNGLGEIIVVSKQWLGFIDDLPNDLRGFADPIKALWRKVSAPFADIFYAEDGVRDKLPRGLERLISQQT